jgi:amino-acid N-acetyltransferase
MLRKARISDVRTIHRLINISSGKGEMLSRSLMDIYGNLRDFFVYIDEEKNAIIGICAMSIIWENLAEIRSLYVDESRRKEGNRPETCRSLRFRGHYPGSLPHLYPDLQWISFRGWDSRLWDRATLSERSGRTASVARNIPTTATEVAMDSNFEQERRKMEDEL